MFKSRKMKDMILTYKRLFDTADGKHVLHDLMKSCHMGASSMGNDPYETAFNEGARSVALRILQTVNADMAQVEEMMNQMDKQEDYDE